MRERLPIRPEISVIPEGSYELRKKLYASRDAGKYPEKTECWKCEAKIPLKELPFSYPIGPFDFYFGRIPIYRCDPCGETYFPGTVLDEIQSLAERELARLDPQPKFRNPNRIKPSELIFQE